MTIQTKSLRLTVLASALWLVVGSVASSADLEYGIKLPLVVASPGVDVVVDEAGLRTAILAANAAGQAPRLELAADILLTEPLPALDNPVGGTVTLAGNGHSLDGRGHGPVLSVASATTVLIDQLTIRGGAADCGGGIYSLGRLTVRRSHILDNQATDGAGICVRHAGDQSRLALEDTVIAGNEAGAGGGGLHAVTSDEDCGAGDGACVVVTATGLTMRDNVADAGGGILVYAGTDSFLYLSIAESLLAGNRATGSGGALYAATDNGQVNAAVSRSALTGNEAAHGGGIYTHGVVGLEWYEGGRVNLSVSNSTLSGNVAAGAGGAIGIFQGDAPFPLLLSPQDPPPFGGAFASIFYSTLTENTAANGSGIRNGGNTTLTAAIIVDNDAAGGDCVDDNFIHSAGHNLDGDGSCGLNQPTDLPGGQADLLPLALNPPGTTPTHALGPASAARDHIPLDFAGCSVWTPNPDQRGVARPQPAESHCDIGAYEADS